MSKMIIRKIESVELLIRKFKLFTNKLGLIKSIKNKLFYIKPSDIKRKKYLNKIKNLQKQIRLNNLNKNLF